MSDKPIPPRGEQRFAALTYSQIARWTGYQVSTVKKYANKGKHRPKKFDMNDMEDALRWIGETCRHKRRVPPWEQPRKPQDKAARELGFWCYQDYLQSELWQDVRALLLPGPCFKCGGVADGIHHKQYTRENLSGQTTGGLVRTCLGCHGPLHGFESQGVLDSGNLEEVIRWVNRRRSAKGFPLIGQPNNSELDTPPNNNDPENTTQTREKPGK